MLFLKRKERGKERKKENITFIIVIIIIHNEKSETRMTASVLKQDPNI